jgi:predicted dehydrogenase
MLQPIRVGVVGTSDWADLHHLPTLKRHPTAALTAICSRNRARVEALAQKYAIPHQFTDYRAMIESANLDAIIVITPDDLHYPITMRALAAGLHVLCEKPLALTGEQAREMYETAAATGRKHMLLFTYRWLPHYRYAQQLIDAGYLGRCLHCHMRYVAGYGREHTYKWRFDRQRGTGVLGNLGSHMIDLARWFMGDIAHVSGRLATFVEHPGAAGAPLDPANDAALLAIEFANGAQGSIQLSAVAHVGDRGQEQHVILHGEEGTLEIDLNFTSAEIRGARYDEERIGTLPVPDGLWGDADRSDLFALLFANSAATQQFIDAIAEDRIVAPTFYDGWKVQEVIDAALESHQSGCWVSMP